VATHPRPQIGGETASSAPSPSVPYLQQMRGVFQAREGVGKAEEEALGRGWFSLRDKTKGAQGERGSRLPIAALCDWSATQRSLHAGLL
jgi:hypothetical protein